MPLGWGTGSEDDVGINIPAKRPGGAADHIAEDIRRIREKYCVPTLFDANPIDLIAGNNVVIDRTQMKINSFVLMVITGTVNLWIGSYSGVPAAGAIPHFQVSAGNPPIQVALPESGYIFTVQASSSGDATGCLSFMGL